MVAESASVDPTANASFPVSWSSHGGLFICTAGDQRKLTELAKHGLALIDLDFTITRRKSNQIFPIDEQDWQWWSEEVPQKLKGLSTPRESQSRAIVIMTNQNNIALAKERQARRLEIFKNQLQAIANHLRVPFIAYIAVAEDMYRKPRPGMWAKLKADLPMSNFKNAVFIGDSAGRKTDWSCSDRRFAVNIGVPLLTPEEFFLNDGPQPFSMGKFDPQMTPYSCKTRLLKELDDLLRNLPSIVVLLAPPGGGKRTFYDSVLQERGPCAIQSTAEVQDHVLCGPADQTTVIACADPSAASRKKLLDKLHNDYNHIGCIYLNYGFDVAWHHKVLSAFSGKLVRSAHGTYLPRVDEVEGMNSAWKQGEEDGIKAEMKKNFLGFEKPTREEGFATIVEPEFKFLGTEDEWKVWRHYWS